MFSSLPITLAFVKIRSPIKILPLLTTGRQNPSLFFRQFSLKMGVSFESKNVLNIHFLLKAAELVSLSLYTVKPLITNTSKEFIKCRILHFLIIECCRYLVFS